MKIEPLDAAGAAPLRFRRLRAATLVTNDWGRYAFLSRAEFKALLSGRMGSAGGRFSELQEKGFIRGRMDFKALAARAAAAARGASGHFEAHTVSVARGCNLKCLYCSASARSADEPGQNMTEETARHVAAFILSSPARALQIEFAGGEPLLNWPAVRLILERVEAGLGPGRRARFALSSNFSLMDADKLDYLARRGVNLCTSLDGPAPIHEANRLLIGGSSHEAPAYWLKFIHKMLDAGFCPKMSPPHAVATVTRACLGSPEGVVDEYLRLGLSRVQLGPVEPFGLARRHWSRVGITAEEFVAFYRRALDYMISLCRRHPVVYEDGAALFLAAVFGRPGSLSRWTEGLSQLAYDIRGDIYPSDEARLLACEGEEFFRLGNARENRHSEVTAHRLVGAMLLWNLRQAQPFCARCAYAPFCQTVRLSAPHHLAEQGLPWGQLPSSRRCAIFAGIFDLLFEKLQDPRIERLFRRWVEMAA